nr:helix-turn-helix domain-containing protein [Acidobacteriota bacterium]
MDVQVDLHRARLARGLSLEEILGRTALSLGVLKKIDEGRYSELPPGLYARSYVKMFAVEVGVEPELALANLEPVLPAAPD